MKEFLHRHGIPFEAIQVEDLADPVEAIRVDTDGLTGTPAVVIDSEARIGFDPEWMRLQLGIDGQK